MAITTNYSIFAPQSSALILQSDGLMLQDPESQQNASTPKELKRRKAKAVKPVPSKTPLFPSRTEKSKSLASENDQYLTTAGTYALQMAGITVFDALAMPKIVEFATQKLGFCLSNFISPKKNALGNIGSPLGVINSMIGSIFGSNITSNILIPAVCEEVESRWFVQEIILRYLPKKIIEKISPDLVHMVDSLPARITRVAAAALIFALLHAHALECSTGGGVAQLIGGLLYSGLYEYHNNSLIHCVNLHVLYNLIAGSK